MNRCRACEAPIVWAKTEEGRPIPLDAEPVPNGNIELRDELAVVVGQHRGRRLYRAHFATCPNADEFRRRR